MNVIFMKLKLLRQLGVFVHYNGNIIQVFMNVLH